MGGPEGQQGSCRVADRSAGRQISKVLHPREHQIRPEGLRHSPDQRVSIDYSLTGACEKVASVLGLGGGFRRVL